MNGKSNITIGGELNKQLNKREDAWKAFFFAFIKQQISSSCQSQNMMTFLHLKSFWWTGSSLTYVKAGSTPTDRMQPLLRYI